MYEAIKQGYVAEVRATKNLEAQLATGGLMDSTLGIRVPVSRAIQRNLIDAKIVNKFKDSSRSGDGKYVDPNTNEANLTYLDLIKRTVTDRSNDAVLLVINHNVRQNSCVSLTSLPSTIGNGSEINTDNSDNGGHTTTTTTNPNTTATTTSTMTSSNSHSNSQSTSTLTPSHSNYASTHSPTQGGGHYHNGHDLTGISHASSYKSSPKRRKQRKRKIVIVDTNTGEEISIKLAYERGIIDEKIYRELSAQQGIYHQSQPTDLMSTSGLTPAAKLNSRQTEDELREKLARLTISDEKQVCIAGILDISIGADPTTRALTIKQAREKFLIDDTTALRLLEAQAATGGVIDQHGERHRLSSAIEIGLITPKDHLRLEEAEKAYFGFSDRLSGKIFSICEALRRGIVSYDISTRLMEYQIATGK